jgi:hypothetical protein
MSVRGTIPITGAIVILLAGFCTVAMEPATPEEREEESKSWVKPNVEPPRVPKKSPTDASATAKDLPEFKKQTYKDGEGKEHIYLVQEPSADPIPKDGCVLIYLHGAAGKEEQGMDVEIYKGSFGRLRKLMNERGWVYVCPRDYKLEGLRKDLEKRYGKRKLFLAGASAGGDAVYRGARGTKGVYSGIIFVSPAITKTVRETGRAVFDAPVWMVCSAREHASWGCRPLAYEWKNKKKRFNYVELPGSDHDASVEQIEWEKAIDFVSAPAGKKAGEKADKKAGKKPEAKKTGGKKAEDAKDAGEK